MPCIENELYVGDFLLHIPVKENRPWLESGFSIFVRGPDQFSEEGSLYKREP
jgi:hypothetical protein